MLFCQSYVSCLILSYIRESKNDTTTAVVLHHSRKYFISEFRLQNNVTLLSIIDRFLGQKCQCASFKRKTGEPIPEPGPGTGAWPGVYI